MSLHRCAGSPEHLLLAYLKMEDDGGSDQNLELCVFLMVLWVGLQCVIVAFPGSCRPIV